LFNLLKATVDGLSNVLFAPANRVTPSQWNREDWLIAELGAYKRPADQASGVRIQVMPRSGIPTGDPARETAIAFVPGNPPPWPGDAKGARRVREWMELFLAHLSLRAPVLGPAAGTISIVFEFVLAPDRMQTTDLAG
jgi:hypothetical protein